MARRSRKTINIPLAEEQASKASVQSNEKSGLRTAAYIRLSVENNGHETDDSIKNQISLVEDFIRRHKDLTLTETYVDNGYSGTKFDRPEFMRMMEDVKRGRIECIVVKDLSRFGRDYLETGYYIETIFPLLNVRFLAITDDFDSSRESDRNSISVPIKNIVNAMYAKDYSRKQETFRELCKKTGRVMGINAPYGYKLSEQTKRLEIDDETAPYVRMVFAWSLAGVTRIEVANRLNYMGVQSPGAYIGRKVGEKWSDSSIKQILYNPAYAGFHIMGKSKTSLYRGISSMKIPRSEWLYFPNYHEPYITFDDYEKINQMIAENKAEMDARLAVRKEVREQMPDCFQGMVYCADCGGRMNFCRGSHHRGYEDISFCYYRCRYKKEFAKCSNKKVQQNYLKIMVMDQLRLLIRVAVDKRRLLLDIQSGSVQSAAITRIQKNISRLSENEREYRDKQLKAYMDYADGVIDEDDYYIIRERLQKSEKDAKDRREKMENRLSEMEQAAQRYEQISQNLDGYLHISEFDENMVKELVSRILVSDDGSVELELKCNDIFADPLIDAYIGQGMESEE